MKIYWVIEARDGKGMGAYSSFCKKAYSLEEAKRIAREMEKKGYEVLVEEDWR